MSYKSNIDDNSRGYYYAGSGDNDWDGRTQETPKSTIQAAIEGANSLIPGAIATVREGQGGIYSEDITLYDGVLVEGSQTAIVTSGAVGITAASGLSFNPQAILTSTDNATLLLINGEEQFGADIRSMSLSGDSNTGVSIQGMNSGLFISISEVTVSNIKSTVIKYTGESVIPSDFNFNTVNLDGDDTTFFEYAPSSPTDTVDINISSLHMDAATIGTQGLFVTSGTAKLRGGTLDSEMVAFTGPNGTISMSCNVIGGNTYSEGSIIYDTVGFIQGNLETAIGGTLQTRSSIIIGNATNAGGMSIKCDSFQGEIVNTGEMFVQIDDYTGTLPANDGSINGIIGGIRYGNWRNRREMETLISADDITNQNPVSLDIPIQVKFGPAQLNPAIEIDALGNVTAIEAGQYEFGFTFQYGRTGSGGISWLFFRLLKNGVQIGTSPFTKLENLNADFPAEFNNTLDLVPSDVITVELLRDSRGNNSGGLLTETPLIGWNPSPSASLSIKRSMLE